MGCPRGLKGYHSWFANQFWQTTIKWDKVHRCTVHGMHSTFITSLREASCILQPGWQGMVCGAGGDPSTLCVSVHVKVHWVWMVQHWVHWKLTLTQTRWNPGLIRTLKKPRSDTHLEVAMLEDAYLEFTQMASLSNIRTWDVQHWASQSWGAFQTLV